MYILNNNPNKTKRIVHNILYLFTYVKYSTSAAYNFKISHRTAWIGHECTHRIDNLKTTNEVNANGK